MNHAQRLTVVAIGVACAQSWPGQVAAQNERFWISGSGGDFAAAGNWLNDTPPDTGDIAVFDLAGTFAVTFGANATLYSLDIRDHATDGKNITFDLDGHTLTLTSTSTSQQSIIMDRHRTNTLHLTGGTLDVLGTLRVGQGTTTTGMNTVVVGANATMIQRGESRLANTGVGTIRIEANGRYEASSTLAIGQFASAIGVLTVTGPVAVADFKPTAAAAQDISVGVQGTGTVEVLNGGTLTNVQDLQIASSHADAVGTVRVEEADSHLKARAMYVGGNTSTAFGTGSVQVRSGGEMELTGATSTSRVYGKGTVEMDRGTLASAGHLNWLAGATYLLRLHAPGDLPMDISGNVDLAMDSGDGTVDLDLQFGSGFSGSIGQKYTVLRYGGTLSGEFKDWTEGVSHPIGAFEFAIDYGSGTNDAIMLTVIPEPGTLGLLLSAAALLALRRRHAGFL